MRWERSALAGALAGVCLGLTSVAVLDGGGAQADAQAGFKVTEGQLQVNQRISQAAVRRSNDALNLLRSIRPAPGTADPQAAKGVLPGAGTGWTEDSLSPELRAKIDAGGPQGVPGPVGPKGGPGSATSWLAKTGNGAAPAFRASSPALTVERTGEGIYRVDFGDRDLRECSWNAVPATDGAAVPSASQIATLVDPADATRLIVTLRTPVGLLVDSGFQTQLTC